jgi:hypothetical protein
MPPADQVRVLAAVLGQDVRFAARPDGQARAEMSATIPAEYVEAFFRYFAEATLDDSKAAGVRALIPDFCRPPSTCTRRHCRTRSPPGPGRGDQRAAEAVEDPLPYHESDHVLNLAYNVLTGGTRLEDIERLRRDMAYMNALGADPVPDPTTAGDFCRRFTEADVLRRWTRSTRCARSCGAAGAGICSAPWPTST